MGSEISKGERMRTHTERTEGDDRGVRNSSAKREMENSTQCVLNLDRLLRFTTQRVVNLFPRLKTPQKTSMSQFGTRCAPNFISDFSAISRGLGKKAIIERRSYGTA